MQHAAVSAARVTCAGEPVSIQRHGQDVIKLPTEAGKMYELTWPR